MCDFWEAWFGPAFLAAVLPDLRSVVVDFLHSHYMIIRDTRKGGLLFRPSSCIDADLIRPRLNEWYQDRWVFCITSKAPNLAFAFLLYNASTHCDGLTPTLQYRILFERQAGMHENEMWKEDAYTVRVRFPFDAPLSSHFEVQYVRPFEIVLWINGTYVGLIASWQEAFVRFLSPAIELLQPRTIVN